MWGHFQSYYPRSVEAVQGRMPQSHASQTMMWYDNPACCQTLVLNGWTKGGNGSTWVWIVQWTYSCHKKWKKFRFEPSNEQTIAIESELSRNQKLMLKWDWETNNAGAGLKNLCIFGFVIHVTCENSRHQIITWSVSVSFAMYNLVSSFVTIGVPTTATKWKCPLCVAKCKTWTAGSDFQSVFVERKLCQAENQVQEWKNRT